MPGVGSAMPGVGSTMRGVGSTMPGVGSLRAVARSEPVPYRWFPAGVAGGPWQAVAHD